MNGGVWEGVIDCSCPFFDSADEPFYVRSIFVCCHQVELYPHIDHFTLYGFKLFVWEYPLHLESPLCIHLYYVFTCLEGVWTLRGRNVLYRSHFEQSCGCKQEGNPVDKHNVTTQSDLAVALKGGVAGINVLCPHHVWFPSYGFSFEGVHVGSLGSLGRSCLRQCRYNS